MSGLKIMKCFTTYLPILLIFLSICTEKTTATTYYLGIDNAVDNSTCGLSTTTPCLTINYILSSFAEDNDTIFILPGEYSISPFVVRLTNLTITSGFFSIFYFSIFSIFLLKMK